MIQDIMPYQLNNQYESDAKPMEKDSVLCIQNQEVLAKAMGEEFILPSVSDIAELEGLIYLFRIGSEAYYLLSSEEQLKDEKREEYRFYSLKELRESGLGPKYRSFAVMTGKHLADWYRDNRYCGRCGSVMSHSEKERAMKCSACGYTSYPRIMPAVIVGVTNGDQILLTRYRVGYQHNALIAGFTEIGETVEETVVREVMEESGLQVKNIRYYKSQPWGVANDILLGFYCDVDGSTEIRMDEQELRYAAWVKREEIELQPDDYSLTNEMMMQFKLGNI